MSRPSCCSGTSSRRLWSSKASSYPTCARSPGTATTSAVRGAATGVAWIRTQSAYGTRMKCSSPTTHDWGDSSMVVIRQPRSRPAEAAEEAGEGGAAVPAGGQADHRRRRRVGGDAAPGQRHDDDDGHRCRDWCGKGTGVGGRGAQGRARDPETVLGRGPLLRVVLGSGQGELHRDRRPCGSELLPRLEHAARDATGSALSSSTP